MLALCTFMSDRYVTTRNFHVICDIDWQSGILCYSCLYSAAAIHVMRDRKWCHSAQRVFCQRTTGFWGDRVASFVFFRICSSHVRRWHPIKFVLRLLWTSRVFSPPRRSHYCRRYQEYELECVFYRYKISCHTKVLVGTLACSMLTDANLMSLTTQCEGGVHKDTPPLHSTPS